MLFQWRGPLHPERCVCCFPSHERAGTLLGNRRPFSRAPQFPAARFGRTQLPCPLRNVRGEHAHPRNPILCHQVNGDGSLVGKSKGRRKPTNCRSADKRVFSCCFCGSRRPLNAQRPFTWRRPWRWDAGTFTSPLSLSHIAISLRGVVTPSPECRTPLLGRELIPEDFIL